MNTLSVDGFLRLAPVTGRQPRRLVARGLDSQGSEHPFNPLNWNIRRLIPQVGVPVAGLWGAANILERRLLDGNALPANPVGRTAFRILGRYAPVINVGYGMLNALGAAVNGYGWRTAAFSAYTGASLLALPWLLQDNRNALKVSRQVATLGVKTVKAALEQPGFQQWMGKAFRPSAVRLRNVAGVVQATLPIGLMLGLLNVTNVGLASPGITLLKPTGNSLRTLLVGGPDPITQPPLLTVLRENFRTEGWAFGTIIHHPEQAMAQSLMEIRTGWNALTHPATPTPAFPSETAYKQPASQPSSALQRLK